MALERLTQNMTEMARRMRDLRPVGEEIHAELLTWQRTVDIGEEKNRLDPSLQNAGHPEHIWKEQATRFTFGTEVPYSVYHAVHRLKGGQKSHMDLPKSVLERIASKISRYVTEGTTL